MPTAISQPRSREAFTAALERAVLSGRATATLLPPWRVSSTSPLWRLRSRVTSQERMSRSARSLVTGSGTKAVSSFPPQAPSASVATKPTMTAILLTLPALRRASLFPFRAGASRRLAAGLGVPACRELSKRRHLGRLAGPAQFPPARVSLSEHVGPMASSGRTRPKCDLSGKGSETLWFLPLNVLAAGANAVGRLLALCIEGGFGCTGEGVMAAVLLTCRPSGWSRAGSAPTESGQRRSGASGLLSYAPLWKGVT